MKTFHEWLNEIAYIGDISVSSLPKVRKKLGIIPSHEDEGVLDIHLDHEFINTILNSSILNLIKPIPSEIYNIFQKAEDNDIVKLSAGDVYDLKKFFDKVNKIIIYQKITNPENFAKEGKVIKDGIRKIMDSLESATFA